MPTTSDTSLLRRFALGALVVIGTVIVLWLLREVAQVLLIVFGGVLLAVFYDGLAGWLADKTPLGRKATLPLVIFGTFALLAGMFWYIGPSIGEQSGQIYDRIPEALEDLRSRLASQPWSEALLSQISLQQSASGSDLLGRITGMFSTALGVLANVVVVVVVGIYCALNPGIYQKGLMLLFPPRHRPRIAELLQSLGQGLRWWLFGRICSMGVVGLLTYLGLLLIGMPLALTLGLLAALLSFVPYIGSLLMFVPAVLIALTESTDMVWQVCVVYAVVQLFESYLITPLIQQRAVAIPPALLITAQLLMGVLAGAVGILLATPLAVTLIILIQMLYVEDTLGEDVAVLGEHH